MADYLSLTEVEKREMLDAIGVSKVEDLFEDVPKSLRVKKLNLPQGKSQQETYNFMRALSKRNKVYDSIFLGAGSYDHFIPSVVKSVCSRSEFVTAYTPACSEDARILSSGTASISSREMVVCREWGAQKQSSKPRSRMERLYST